MSDALSVIIHGIDRRIDEWSEAAQVAAQAEADFKAFCALKKKALMDAGRSGVAAESELQSLDGWAEHYMAVQTAHIKAEELKQRIKLGHAAFDAQRSREATARQFH